MTPATKKTLLDVSDPSPTRVVEEMLAPDWLADHEPNRFRLSTSGIKCPRALYFRCEGEGLLKPLARSIWVNRAKELALRDRFTLGDEMVNVQHGQIHLYGSVDLLVHDGNEPSLAVRFHATDDDMWDAIEHAALEEHKAEANMLAFGTGAPRWSICYVRDSTGELREHVGPMNPMTVHWILDRFEEVAGYRMQRRAPRCPFSSHVPAGECCSCRWSGIEG